LGLEKEKKKKKKKKRNRKWENSGEKGEVNKLWC
jgi:hypothetical protein